MFTIFSRDFIPSSIKIKISCPNPEALSFSISLSPSRVLIDARVNGNFAGKINKNFPSFVNLVSLMLEVCKLCTLKNVSRDILLTLTQSDICELINLENLTIRSRFDSTALPKNTYKFQGCQFYGIIDFLVLLNMFNKNLEFRISHFTKST